MIDRRDSPTAHAREFPLAASTSDHSPEAGAQPDMAAAGRHREDRLPPELSAADQRRQGRRLDGVEASYRDWHEQ